jgi:drug/metabolite transporter (DMT)-like permease
MKIGQIALRIFFLIIANDTLDTVAQLLMKRGLAHFSINTLFVSGAGLFRLGSPDTIFLWLGVVVYALTFFMWMIVLREVDLSVALPIGSMSYIFIPMAAILILHEHMNLFRWVGIVFIVLGICFVSQSKMRKGEHNV